MKISHSIGDQDVLSDYDDGDGDGDDDDDDDDSEYKKIYNISGSFTKS